MPLTTTMHRSQLPRSGMALGGIGAGSFEIRQDGGFANWQIFNNWPLFPGPRYPHNPKHTLFFLLRVREENADPRIVLLQIEDSHGAAAIDGHEYQYMFPWLSAVDVIRTTASFPFAELDYEQDGQIAPALPLAGQATPVAGGTFAAETMDDTTMLRFAAPFNLTPETPVAIMLPESSGTQFKTPNPSRNSNT